MQGCGEDAFRTERQEETWATRRQHSAFTHISTTGHMFYIIFGAAAGLHTAQVQLLIKNLHLES